jgi:hypothetical protein
MALTAQQNIPEKPIVSEPWTFRRLFPFAGAVTTLSKVFINPFDVLLGYLVFILGAAELLGRHVSWFFWVFAILILAADIFERHTGIPSDTKPEEKPKK